MDGGDRAPPRGRPAVSAERIGFRSGSRAAGIVGAVWLAIGTCASMASPFDGRRYFTAVGFVLGPALLVLARRERVQLDARRGVLRLRTPRFPLGTATRVWPLRDVAAFETELVPGAIPFVYSPAADGWRLVCLLRSGERVPLRAAEISDTRLRRFRDRANDLLARSRTA